jgi:hypothetical protein
MTSEREPLEQFPCHDFPASFRTFWPDLARAGVVLLFCLDTFYKHGAIFCAFRKIARLLVSPLQTVGDRLISSKAAHFGRGEKALASYPEDHAGNP